MAASRVIGQGVIVITANTQAAQASLAAVSATSGKAASSIITNFTAAAKSIQSSPLISNLETVSALFIQAGGSVSRFASIATSLIRPVAILGTAFGSATAAVGAFAVPLAGLAIAGGGLFAVANAATEAAERLEKLGITVDQQAASALHNYSAATDDLAVAMDQLKVAIGADVAGDLATLASAAAGVVRWFTELREDAQGFANAMQSTLRVALAIGSLGLTELAVAGVDAAASMNHVADATERVTQTTLDAEAAERKMLVALGLLVSVEEEDRAAKDRQTAAAKALRLEEEHAQLVMDARIAGYRATADAAEAAADEESAAAAKTREQMLEDNQAILDGVEQISEARRKAADESKKLDLATAVSAVNAFAQVAEIGVGAFQSIAQAQVDMVASRVAAGEELTAAEAKFANRAMDQAEALAIIQAGISATIAGLGIVSNLAPFIGPAAVPVGVTIAGGLFTAAVAGIEAGQPFRYSYDPGGFGGARRDEQDRLDDYLSDDSPDNPAGGGDNPRGGKPDRPGGTSRGRSGGAMTAEIRILPPQRANKRPRRGR